MPSGPKRDIIAPRHESLAREFDDLSTHPREYGEARLWIVARDAHWIFAYWEFDPAEHPQAMDSEGKAHFFIRLARGAEVEITQEIPPDAGDLFLRVHQPDAEYSAELGFFSTQGVWCFIAQSGTTRTPPETGAELKEPGADNGKGIRRLRSLLAQERASGGDTGAAARVREKAAARHPWTAEQEAMLVRLLAAETAQAKAQKRTH